MTGAHYFVAALIEVGTLAAEARIQDIYRQEKERMRLKPHISMVEGEWYCRTEFFGGMGNTAFEAWLNWAKAADVIYVRDGWPVHL